MAFYLLKQNVNHIHKAFCSSASTVHKNVSVMYMYDADLRTYIRYVPCWPWSLMILCDFLHIILWNELECIPQRYWSVPAVLERTSGTGAYQRYWIEPAVPVLERTSGTGGVPAVLDCTSGTGAYQRYWIVPIDLSIIMEINDCTGGQRKNLLGSKPKASNYYFAFILLY